MCSFCSPPEFNQSQERSTQRAPRVAQLQGAMKGADTVKSLLEKVLGEVDRVVMLGAFEGVAGVQDLDYFRVSKTL
jgi:hypothetical protein